MTIGEILMRLLLVLGLGALMGLERDESWRVGKDKAALVQKAQEARRKFSFITAGIPSSGLGGVRTYTLISLLGGLAGLAHFYGLSYISGILVGAVILFILVAFILNYFDKNSFGLTTEISLMFIFVLSLLMLATELPVKIVVALAVVDTIILSMKTELRGLVSKFSKKEVVDTIKFVLFALVVLPYLPNVSYGPENLPFVGDFLGSVLSQALLSTLQIFNPFVIWLVVVFISGVNFLGYFLTKSLGNKIGLSITGFFGGLISSTAVTQAMASKSKEFKDEYIKNSLVLSTVFANLTSFIRILLVAAVLNLELGLKLVAPMLTMSVFLLIWAVMRYRRDLKLLSKEHTKKYESNELKDLRVNFKTPFAIKPALAFAALYVVVITFTKVAVFFVGDSGFIVSSMISAISGLDAITVNTANVAGTLVPLNLGVMTLVAAAVINLLVKMVFVNFLADNYFKKTINALFLISSAIGIIVTAFVIWW